MNFGDFIRAHRIKQKMTLRQASIGLGISCVRLSELEREVAKESPTSQELEQIGKIYNLDLTNVQYKFNEEKYKKELSTLKLIKDKTPQELLNFGIFACKCNE